MKNVKNRYSDPDPDPLWNRIRIHFFQMWIRGSGSTITESWIRGSESGSTFPKCGYQDPDPRQNDMDPKRCGKGCVTKNTNTKTQCVSQLGNLH